MLLFAVKEEWPRAKHKWAANPRKVSAASVHFAMKGGKHKRVIVNSSEAAYFHYHGSINKAKADLCQLPWVKREQYKNLSVTFQSRVQEFEYDDSMLPLVRLVKLETAANNTS